VRVREPLSNTRFIAATLGVVGLLAALYIADRHRNVHRGAVGDRPRVADLELSDVNGRKLDLAGYRGQVLLLDFWATWCGPCREEIPHFVQFQDKYREQGFRIVGIAMDDTTDPVRSFYEKYKMNYPVAMGSARVAERFGGILGLPVSILIGRDGRVRQRHVGQVDAAVLELEIQRLLQAPAAATPPGL
jgi:cytochrome c biogenesis protein CcmG, thiol:disulfide interchange protein DsbE